MTDSPLRAYRSALLYCLDDPTAVGVAASYRYLEDGLLLVEAGRIRAVDHAARLLPGLPPVPPSPNVLTAFGHNRQETVLELPRSTADDQEPL